MIYFICFYKFKKGTFTEKLRAGASGIAGFYTATGVGTLVETGGLPIKYIKGTLIPEIISAPKEVNMII